MPSEGSETPIADSPKNAVKSPEMSRRKFLEGAVATATVAAVGLKAGESEAKPEKPLTERQKFFNNLRHDAIHEKTEKNHIYTQYPDGSDETRKITDFSETTTSTFMNFGDIASSLQAGVQVVDYAHTHPMEMCLNTTDPSNREVVQRYIDVLRQNSEHNDNYGLPLNPPSFFVDIYGIYKARKYLSQFPEYRHEKVKFSEGDSAGVWEYDVDPDNKYLARLDEAITLQDRYMGDPIVFEAAKKFMKDHPGADPRLAFNSVYNDKNVTSKLSEESKKTRDEMEEYERTNSALFRPFLNREYDFAYIPITDIKKQKEAVEKMRREYAKMGIRISFTPYEQLKDKK